MLISAGSSQAAEKLHSEGGGGFRPPHKASKINAGFSPGGTFFEYDWSTSSVLPWLQFSLRLRRLKPSSQERPVFPGALCGMQCNRDCVGVA